MNYNASMSAISPYIIHQYCTPEDWHSFPEITGMTWESEKVKPGNLFVAGKDYIDYDYEQEIASALSAGASVIVTDFEVPASPNVPWIYVSSAARAIARMAQKVYDYPAKDMHLWGVTGTNGKTTSTYLFQQILAASSPERRVGMFGTIVTDTVKRRFPNMTEQSTPIPFRLQPYLAEMREMQATDCVMEMTSIAIGVEERVGDEKFAGAIFTNLTQDHLDVHGTMEEYFRCKTLLFTKMLKPDGIAVINVDDEYGRRLLAMAPAGVKWYSFGFSPDADYVISDLGNQHFAINGTEYACRMLGKFNLYNLTGVIVLAEKAGISHEVITKVVADFTGAPGRLQPIALSNGATAYVDFAHTDDAITKAIDAVRQICRGRLIIVFGCGGDRDRTKRPKMAKAAAAADVVIVTSDNPRSEDPMAIINEILPGFPPDKQYSVEVDRKAAILQAILEAGPDDVILVAGKGHENYQEIKDVKHDFSDVDVISAAGK